MAKKLTCQEFIDKALAVHGELYSYSNAVYINGRTKVEILCSVHGAFEQQPSAHLAGQGCPRCSGRGNYTPPIYEKLVAIKHLGKYTYSLDTTLTPASLIKITCPLHGVFTQRASSHLEGYGCKECAWDNMAHSYQDFTAKASKVHNNTYSYAEETFNPRDKAVNVTCSVHGNFQQDKSNHIQGHGCPKCYIPGFDKSKPGILYYLKIVSEGMALWKIGITNRSIDERFTAKDLKRIEVLYQHEFANGGDASDLERDLLRVYKAFQYTGPNILRDGNTGLFTSDIFINQLT